MKDINRLLVICLLATLNLSMFAQENAARLVVRMDDLGAFHSVNKACVDCYTQGIGTSVEVMPVAAWFPEAVKMLRENPGLDVGVHLAITSEWENCKWRPLTDCPSLVDENGYFFPMMSPRAAYPGQSVKENKWNLAEIEREFRAQIELALREIPRVSHLTGHMGSMTFDPAVWEMANRLGKEYHLSVIGSANGKKEGYSFVSYDGKSDTPAEKKESFARMLAKLEPGKRYIFLDHPAYADSEMETVMHIGYEDVAADRQGVTDVLTDPDIRGTIEERGIRLISMNQLTKSLPRGEASAKMDKAFDRYLKAVEKEKQNIHSIMIVQDGKVLKEKWMGEGAPDKPHLLYSVSKTFTSLAVGFAVAEGKLKVTDKVISFFPEQTPERVSENLAAMEVRHLLTMTTGYASEPTGRIRKADTAWIKGFLAGPIEEKPGSRHVYNTLASYMLSAIVQKVTGEKVIDYLYPRLFRPLGITGAVWKESAEGITCGGWGLYLKTEDLAKAGQFLLQKGEWNGERLLPASWIEEASSPQVPSYPAYTPKEECAKMRQGDPKSDWLQGYGYQMWRCRHNAFRADGANGQFILVIPDKNAVIAMTAFNEDMQAELNLIWKYIYPAL